MEVGVGLSDFMRETGFGGCPLTDWRLEKHGIKNILFYKDKNYIPDDLDLCWDIVKMFHNHETAGHPGELET